MPYASDKLRDGFIRRNRPRFAKEVKARDMLLQLPCLTTTDREEVEAAHIRHGNTYAMTQLLDNLTRRENWPEEFISALEECEHLTLAQEVRDAYEALKQPRNQKQKPVAPSARSSSTGPAHVPPPSPVLSTRAHPQVSSLPPQQAAQSGPLPTPSSSRSVVPPRRSTEPQLRPEVPPEAFIHPNATNQPAFSPSMAASLAPAPSMVQVPPANSPLAAPVATVRQSEGAQAPHFGVSPEFGIPSASTTGVPPPEISEPQSVTPNPQTLYTCSPEPPQPMRTPIQETSPPSCEINPLHQQPEETSDPTLYQVRTHQHSSASSEDPVIHLPPPGTQNITPPAPARATVSTHVVAMTFRHPPTPGDIDTEEECFSKPGVLQSMNEEPCPEPCSVTLGDLEISRPAADLASEAHAQVSINTDECSEPVQVLETCSVTTNDLELSLTRCFPQESDVCPEPVTRSHQVSNLADHTRGSVSSHNSGSPDCQRDGLIDDPAFSPHQVPIEDQFESVTNNSQDQGTEVYEIHFSQEPSIHNFDGNVVSSQQKSVMNRSDTQQQPSTNQPTNQHSLIQSMLGREVHLRSGTNTKVNAEKSENKSQGEGSGHQEKGARNREEQREMTRASLIPGLHNVSLFPAAAIVIGVCALVFAWRLRK